jgi:hypothetical protein
VEAIVSVVGVPEPHDVNASAASTTNKNVIFFIWINIQTIFAFTNPHHIKRADLTTGSSN